MTEIQWNVMEHGFGNTLSHNLIQWRFVAVFCFFSSGIMLDFESATLCAIDQENLEMISSASLFDGEKRETYPRRGRFQVAELC